MVMQTYLAHSQQFLTKQRVLEAQKNGAVLTFRVTFNEDKGPNPNFDEPVTATTTSTAQLNRPNNSNSVNIAAPTFNNTDNL